jgi:hypothetical protein
MSHAFCVSAPRWLVFCPWLESQVSQSCFIKQKIPVPAGSQAVTVKGRSQRLTTQLIHSVLTSIDTLMLGLASTSKHAAHRQTCDCWQDILVCQYAYWLTKSNRNCKSWLQYWARSVCCTNRVQLALCRQFNGRRTLRTSHRRRNTGNMLKIDSSNCLMMM